MTKHYINRAKLKRMELLSFKNGLRLHRDAIRLFKLKSYPSAYTLSVLSMEEFGKWHSIGYYLFYWGEGQLSEKEEREWINMLYDHVYKQQVFRNHCAVHSWTLRSLKQISDTKGHYERSKQDSIYIGLRRDKRIVNLKSKIASPFNVRRSKTQTQITYVNDFLLESTIGNIQQYLTFDNEDVTKVMNRKLLAEIKKWPFRGQQIKKIIYRAEKKFGKT